jgi:hypothetical protein
LANRSQLLTDGRIFVDDRRYAEVYDDDGFCLDHFVDTGRNVTTVGVFLCDPILPVINMTSNRRKERVKIGGMAQWS